MERFKHLISLRAIGPLLIIAVTIYLPPSSASVADDYCNANPYGIDGHLAEWEVSDLSYLAFPQDFRDMRNRFGFPACFDERVDYFRVTNSPAWVGIEYEGRTAIGYRTWAGE